MYLFFVQIRKLGSIPIVKPSWITDSIDMGKLLNYRKYLLYTNQSTCQPALHFDLIQSSYSKEDPVVNEQFIEKSGITGNQSNIGDLVFEGTQLNPDESAIEEPFKTNINVIDNVDFNILDKTDHSDIKCSGEPHNVQVSQGSTIDNLTHCIDHQKNRSGSTTKTAADPNFLTEFYNNSRLHLISTLGAQYKQLVNELREKSIGHFPGKAKLKEKGMMSPLVLFCT